MDEKTKDVEPIRKPNEPDTVVGYHYCGCADEAGVKPDNLALSRIHQKIGEGHRTLAALYLELAVEESGR